MIRASRNALAALAAAACLTAVPARGAIETDPLALYTTMRTAYDRGVAKNWPFASEQYYESTILDTGRAYSLFRPSDSNYGEVANLAVDVATQLHYDPLTNDDAALWYVTEAANYVEKNADDAHKAEATALRGALDAGQASTRVLAAQAESDALANVAAFPADGDARVALLVADVRAYVLSKDATYRSALLQHAADPLTPLARTPDPEYGETFAIASSALTDPGFTDADRTAARTIAYRRAHTPELKVIARVRAVSHEGRLTRTAPADEYFGNLKYSPIGVNNEIVRLNKYLDKGWGYRMEHDALQLDSAVEDWQKQYPRDDTLPRTLLQTIQTLRRVDTDTTKSIGERLKAILLVQYADSPQARELSSS